MSDLQHPHAGQTCPDGYTCKCIQRQSYLSPSQKTFGSNILKYKIQNKKIHKIAYIQFSGIVWTVPEFNLWNDLRYAQPCPL